MTVISRSWFLVLIAALLSPGLSIAIFFIRSDEILQHYAVENREVEAPDPTGLTLVRDNRWDGWTDEITRLVEALSAERAQLDTRARELDELEKRLASEQTELISLRDDMDERRNRFSAMIAEIEIAEVKNLRDLARTYAAMSPAGASRIFSQMDDDMVVKILFFMKPDAVAPVLEEMARAAEATEARRAARLSERLRLMLDPEATNGNLRR